MLLNQQRKTFVVFMLEVFENICQCARILPGMSYHIVSVLWVWGVYVCVRGCGSDDSGTSLSIGSVTWSYSLSVQSLSSGNCVTYQCQTCWSDRKNNTHYVSLKLVAQNRSYITCSHIDLFYQLTYKKTPRNVDLSLWYSCLLYMIINKNKSVYRVFQGFVDVW